MNLRFGACLSFNTIRELTKNPFILSIASSELDNYERAPQLQTIKLRYQYNQWTVALRSVGDKKCSNGASAENNQARDMNDPGRLNVVPVSVQWIAPAGKSNKVASKGKFIVAADTLLLFDSFNRWRKCFLLIATIVESSGSGTARTIYNGSFTHHQFYDKLFCYTFRIKLFCAGGKWAQYWLHLACVCHNFLKCNWKHFS